MKTEGVGLFTKMEETKKGKEISKFYMSKQKVDIYGFIH